MALFPVECPSAAAAVEGAVREAVSILCDVSVCLETLSSPHRFTSALCVAIAACLRVIGSSSVAFIY